MAQLNPSLVTSNISSSDGHSPHPSWDSRSFVPVVVLSICFILGFPGNIAVIILKPNWQHLSSLSQSLMLNLAVSDLLCLLTLPLWIYALLYGWTFSLVGCKLIAYLVYCSVYGSLMTVTVLSIQRYLQTVHQQRSLHQVGAKKLLALLWLISMILSIPALVVRQVVNDKHQMYCKRHYPSRGQRVSVLLTESLVGFVSLSIMAFAYTSLYRKVHQAAFFNNPQTTRLITSITVTFFLLWVPYHLINVLEVAAISLKIESLLKFCEDNKNTFVSLTFINNTLNPLLYAFTSNHASTICHKSVEQLMQKLRIPKTRSGSTNITTSAATR